MKKNRNDHRAGFVAIIGAPNAGKSTLLNRMLQEKVAIVTPKPQTTRHRILGICNGKNSQIIFWDTPGYHDSSKVLNMEMIGRALSALGDSDVCLWLVDGKLQGPDHQLTLELIKEHLEDKGLLIAINKIDLMDKLSRERLKSELSTAFPETKVLGISAFTGEGTAELKRSIVALLPKSPPLYPEDALTDQPMRVIAAEYVREAIFKLTRDELPYSTAVTVDEYNEPTLDENGVEREKTYIAVTIHVEKEKQKAIMIGKNGSLLFEIGKSARLNMERIIGGPVFLKLFVRVTKNWSKNKRIIQEFGYGDKK
jgi:GTP-binding protein Era